MTKTKLNMVPDPHNGKLTCSRDVDLRYSGTLVKYQGRPYRCSSDPMDHWADVLLRPYSQGRDTFSGDPLQKNMLEHDITTDFTLGYVKYKSFLLFLSRNSRRNYQQGLSQDNIHTGCDDEQFWSINSNPLKVVCACETQEYSELPNIPQESVVLSRSVALKYVGPDEYRILVSRNDVGKYNKETGEYVLTQPGFFSVVCSELEAVGII